MAERREDMSCNVFYGLPSADAVIDKKISYEWVLASSITSSHLIVADPKLKVAIVYVCQPKELFFFSDIQCRVAGIGGSMLASCLAKMDKQKRIELDIYEAATKPAAIGAGIILWPQTFEMLTNIGLEGDILKFDEQVNADSCSHPLMFEYSGLLRPSTCLRILEKRPEERLSTP